MTRAASGGRVLRHLVIAAVLATTVVALYRYRRTFIRSFFTHGPAGAPPSLDRPAVAPAPLPPTGRTRVVLLDGIGLETARTLPAYRAACEAGLDLIVDVGFPTVSLPVQRVLWTGLTQQQTGFLYVIKQQPPPPGSIPAQIPGSVAIAEAHPEIVDSLGFSETETTESDDNFERAATTAVAGDAPLVFVHLLRADAAGHKHGGGSAEYRQAARAVDAVLGRLRAAEAARGGEPARWFVLSDHGHRAAGGHGGSEPHIRRVRACIAGAIPGALDGPAGRLIHLVDLARAIADSTGARLPDSSAARPLAVALAAPPSPDQILPAPSPGRWIAAALVVLLALAATAWAIGGRMSALPWWWPIAYLSVLVLEQAPTLSVPMVYPPLGRTMYVAALPGLCALAVLAALSLRRLSALRVAIAQLAVPLSAAVAAAILAGAAGSGPPLTPGWTARTSLYLVLAFTGAAVVALAVLASAARPPSDRTRRSGTRGSGS